MPKIETNKKQKMLKSVAKCWSDNTQNCENNVSHAEHLSID